MTSSRRLFIGAGIALTIAVSFWLPWSSTSGQDKDSKIPNDPATGFALVELFTSEGCSSCPPADAVLADLVHDAKKNNRRVYCIAFPVDYWNKLGWTEPHGDALHTKRQQEYSKVLRTEQIYTPQMIMNGTEEFVGSNKAKAQKSIGVALDQKVATTLTLGLEKPPGAGGVTIAYDIGSAPKTAVLNVAVVESGLVSKVTRGENAGQTLAHENVVRVFTTVAIDRTGKGTVELKFPDGLDRKKSQVIAYVQNPETKAIVGASSIDLNTGKCSR